MIDIKHIIHVAATVLLAMALAGVYWLGGRNVKQQWALADAQRAALQSGAELAAFKAEAAKLNGVSAQFETSVAALRDVQPKIIERYNHVVEKQPLPAGCVIGPERLRELNAAVAAANAAGQSGAAVPAGQSSGVE